MIRGIILAEDFHELGIRVSKIIFEKDHGIEFPRGPSQQDVSLHRVIHCKSGHQAAVLWMPSSSEI